MTDLEPLLMFCDHYVVEFLYEQARLVHHRLNPCLHQQTGLKYKISTISNLKNNNLTNYYKNNQNGMTVIS